MKTALITGVTGQDGSYLAELLLEKGYVVYGMYRRSSNNSEFERIKHLAGKINLICGEMTDFGCLAEIIKLTKPDELYNLAAQSHVGISFEQEYYTYEVNWFGVERIIGIIKKHSPETKIYQASTSELFGEVKESPQSERTPFNPVSPYAKAKLKAHEAIKKAREDGLFACSGILFNHESPRRGIEFVTKKITDGLARIKLNIPQRETGKNYLEVGNLNSKRDWGHSKDYVRAMWMMLQRERPEDYVVSSEVTHSVREFIELVAKKLDIAITWRGEGINEEGYDSEGRLIIRVNPKFFRPCEVKFLQGDSTKAHRELGWHPNITFNQLVDEMVSEDLKRLRKNIPEED